MKLSFVGIRSAGELDKERIVYQVEKTCDVGRHVLLCARKGAGPADAISGMVPNSYWFPDKEVQEGDLIVVYTKTGTSSAKKKGSGGTSHFFYWHLKEAVWNQFRTPVLCEIQTFETAPGVPDPADETPA